MPKTQATAPPKPREPDAGTERAGQPGERAGDDRLATETAAGRQDAEPKPQTKAK